MFKLVQTAIHSLFFIGVLATSVVANATVENVAPYTELTQLKPDRDYGLTTQQVVTSLLRGHYESHPLNDQLSSQILDQYIKDLDSTRSYFLESDIKEFEKFRFQFDEDLNRGKLENAFFMFNRYQQRVNERLSFLLTELNEHASQYKFDTDETLELDRENAKWAKKSRELDDLWRKRLKNSMLGLRTAGKEDKAIIELLQKRYQNQLNRIHQIKADDAYQTFMNAVTSTFDPHTQYLSPRNTENFNINMSLSLQGIGAVLQADDEFTKVARLVPAGPAEKAGNLQPADKIIGVGQAKDKIVDVIGWRLDEVVDLIRGPKGSTVHLEIIPAAGSDSKVISIVREEVKLEEQSAKKEVLTIQDGEHTRKIGVIEIPTFYIDFQGRMENKPEYTSTTRDVFNLLNELQDENDLDGLIIDLRNNGGGSLEEAVNLTGLFIGSGPVVQVRNANGKVEVLNAHFPSPAYTGPVTVLVNRLSASASEIFAGAIQDYGRGLVVGSQTFGKGTVQSLRPLRSGQLKITQAKFYRISGDSTQNKGVIPDIEYPSLFDTAKIGESSLDEAMPWDAIAPVKYRADSLLNQTLAALNKKHLERTLDNPDFLFLKQQRELLDELQTQTTVSLNEKTRAKEREANDQRRLALENNRRTAKGMKPLESLEELDKKAEDELNNLAKKEDSKKDKEDDALLIESAKIMLDLEKTVAALAANKFQEPVSTQHP